MNKEKKILKVGLTGGIGSGKTTVSEMFGRLGAIILNADIIVHQTLKAGENGYEEVVREFGQGIKCLDGSISRKKLADLVFNDEIKRNRLNEILHPFVWEAEAEMYAKMKNCGIAVTDAAMIIETGGWKRFDRIIVVNCSDEIRISRLVKRGMSIEDIQRRMSAQMPLKAKLNYADYVIDNNGEESMTYENVKKVYSLLKDDLGG